MSTLNYILRQTQESLKKYLVNKLKKFGYENVNGYREYIYAEGTMPVMLVAHMDIVHKHPPTDIFYDQRNRIIWSPTGIGGDDRCGIYAILQLLSEGYRPSILFTEDEEIGGWGAIGAAYDIQPNVNYLIEIDRRGNNEAVFYDCDNKDFKKMILSVGFTEAVGTFSDISKLSPAWDIASVNLSAGYVNEHSDVEYINLNYLDKTLSKIKKLFKYENTIRYDFCQVKKSYKTYLAPYKPAPAASSPAKIYPYDGYIDANGVYHDIDDEDYDDDKYGVIFSSAKAEADMTDEEWHEYVKTVLHERVGLSDDDYGGA